MEARDSPAFAAQRQVFHSQAPSIQPVPMAEATTGPSHQNTAHLQSSQSALIPPYQAPFVPFTYGMPPTFSQAYNFQYPSTLRQILPKPQVMADSQSSSSTSRPPDFITHVQSIRKSLYQLCGIDEAQEPPREGQAYSKWRKLVIQQGKQHNMSHYIMVARLSNRCFSVVLQIPNRLNNKVTQGDFMALYNKSEEEQFRLLSDVLEGHISFQELKRQKVIRCCIFFLNLVLRKLFFNSLSI